MAWIEKRRGGFLVRWKEQDGTPASRQVGSRDEAKLLRVDVEKALLTGSYVAKAIREETFGAYARGVLDGALNLEASTLYSYEGIFGKWILPRLGHLKMEELDQRVLRRFFSDIAAAGAGAPTQAKLRRLLSKILTQAVDEGVYARSPLRGVATAKELRREISVLTSEQVAGVALAIRPRYRPLVWLAAYGQLRYGEATGLQERDIDRENGRIALRRSLKGGKGGVYAGPPKTAAGRRTVTLPAWIMASLAAHQLEYPSVDGYLFTTEAGNLIARGAFWPVWREALGRAGFAEPFPRFHDLRHTGVSLLIKQGWNPRSIMERVGHSKIAMTLEVYGHLFPGDQEAMAAGLEAFAPTEAKVVNLR